MAFKPAAAAATQVAAALPSNGGKAAQQTTAISMHLDEVQHAWHTIMLPSIAQPHSWGPVTILMCIEVRSGGAGRCAKHVWKAGHGWGGAAAA